MKRITEYEAKCLDGVMANVTDNWKWHISEGYLGDLFGNRSDDVRISIG